jgi:hypothetical protein
LLYSVVKTDSVICLLILWLDIQSIVEIGILKSSNITVFLFLCYRSVDTHFVYLGACKMILGTYIFMIHIYLPGGLTFYHI